MRKIRIGAALVAGFVMMVAGPLSAQQRQQAPNSNLNAEDQLSPSQMQQPMPGAVATPGGAPGHAPAKHTATAGSPAVAVAEIKRGDCSIAHRGVQRPVREGFEQSQARHGVRFAQRHF